MWSVWTQWKLGQCYMWCSSVSLCGLIKTCKPLSTDGHKLVPDVSISMFTINLLEKKSHFTCKWRVVCKYVACVIIYFRSWMSIVFFAWELSFKWPSDLPIVQPECKIYCNILIYKYLLICLHFNCSWSISNSFPNYW